MSLTLLSWRREIAAMYRTVRDESNVEHAHEYWRARRDELFANHPDSPLTNAGRRQFSGLTYGPYDHRLRFEPVVDSDVEPISFETETGTDGLVRYRRIGRVGLGDLGVLDLWWLDSYGGGVFLPFADRHPRSYPGGRYVLDTTKGADLGGAIDLQNRTGSLVVDLNFSYNPSCAYDPKWSCPLAPGGNRIDAAIDAGEHHSDE